MSLLLYSSIRTQGGTLWTPVTLQNAKFKGKKGGGTKRMFAQQGIEPESPA